MILRTRGKSLNEFDDSIVGYVTRDINKLDENTFLILEDNIKISPDKIFKGIITTHKELSLHNTQINIIYKIPSLDHLTDGDIIAISNDGNVNTLYRVNSFQNTLLVTERCNSNCLMCSQPPKDKDDLKRLFLMNSELIKLIPKDCIEIGISGGEPTLMGELFFDLLKLITQELPNTEVHVLTNGRSFAWNELAEKLYLINNPRIMLGIPLYSDYYLTHDYIVQAENAFNQTVLGLHNLARYEIRTEIRIVLHKVSIPRLVKLSHYIYKNLPFVEHIAFMGLEYIGYTPHNIDKLWIDPYDYKNELEESVLYLADRRLNVSIYNTPLCIIPDSIKEFNRKSISDWKNDYLPECQKCTKIDECGGLFVWNLKKHSEHITPFKIN